MIQVKENFSLNIEISLHMCYNKLKRKGHFFQSLYGGRGVSHLPIFHSLVSSCKSNSRIANVPLSVCPSVCQSVTKTPQPIRIAPNNHQAYQPLSLSTIEPIDHQAYRPSSLSTIEPIKHQAYQASSLSTIEPINHRASWPSSLSTIIPFDHQAYPIKWSYQQSSPLATSLSTLVLLSRLLSLSACSLFQ